jgi:uncharacterized repeat protein (TIGR04042 family)
MPEMIFVVRWPDGAEERCYSPSRVVREYLEVGRTYAVGEFVRRSRSLLRLASDRVLAKRGFSCSGALDQLDAIESRAATYDPDAPVTVVSFEGPDGV